MVETLTDAWSILLMLPFLAAAMGTDIARRRISNVLIVLMLACGIAFQTMLLGANGFLASLAGAGSGLLILLPLYAVGGMGAGDVKLLAAVGSFLGPWGVVLAGVFALCAGGVLAMAVLLWRGFGAFAEARRLLPSRTARAHGAIVRLPYSLAIAAGAIVAAYQLGMPNDGMLLSELSTW